MAESIIQIAPTVTDVFEITNGIKTRVGKAIDMNFKNRLDARGCPQWIDQIIYADDLDASQAAQKTPKLRQSGVTGSCVSSRDTVATKVDSNGNAIQTKTVAFVFVPKFHPPSPISPANPPIADEIWFSSVEFPEIDPTIRNGFEDVEDVCSKIPQSTVKSIVPRP